MPRHVLPGANWTLVLRRRPARIVQGQPEGGYTDAYELICCDCGDDPDLDYREVSPQLRRIRGPYRIAAGVAAYTRHIRLYHARPVTRMARTGGAADDGSGRRPLRREEQRPGQPSKDVHEPRP
jgi:hypothetical protein